MLTLERLWMQIVSHCMRGLMEDYHHDKLDHTEEWILYNTDCVDRLLHTKHTTVEKKKFR